jgi:hypothetical protein
MINTVLYGQANPSNESIIAKPWLPMMNLKKSHEPLTFISESESRPSWLCVTIIEENGVFDAGLLTGFLELISHINLSRICQMFF